jgi:hypothetical protein
MKNTLKLFPIVILVLIGLSSCKKMPTPPSLPPISNCKVIGIGYVSGYSFDDFDVTYDNVGRIAKILSIYGGSQTNYSYSATAITEKNGFSGAVAVYELDATKRILKAYLSAYPDEYLKYSYNTDGYLSKVEAFSPYNEGYTYDLSYTNGNLTKFSEYYNQTILVEETTIDYGIDKALAITSPALGYVDYLGIGEPFQNKLYETFGFAYVGNGIGKVSKNQAVKSVTINLQPNNNKLISNTDYTYTKDALGNIITSTQNYKYQSQKGTNPPIDYGTPSKITYTIKYDCK